MSPWPCQLPPAVKLLPIKHDLQISLTLEPKRLCTQQSQHGSKDIIIKSHPFANTLNEQVSHTLELRVPRTTFTDVRQYIEEPIWVFVVAATMGNQCMILHQRLTRGRRSEFKFESISSLALSFVSIGTLSKTAIARDVVSEPSGWTMVERLCARNRVPKEVVKISDESICVTEDDTLETKGLRGNNVFCLVVDKDAGRYWCVDNLQAFFVSGRVWLPLANDS
ncbi:hypothetical protein HG531_001304 [Fusarium graminearum]|nr:hypothetical protein HG531_001304 [Fusarium graminearum]